MPHLPPVLSRASSSVPLSRLLQVTAASQARALCSSGRKSGPGGHDRPPLILAPTCMREPLSQVGLPHARRLGIAAGLSLLEGTLSGLTSLHPMPAYPHHLSSTPAAPAASSSFEGRGWGGALEVGPDAVPSRWSGGTAPTLLDA